MRRLCPAAPPSFAPLPSFLFSHGHLSFQQQHLGSLPVPLQEHNAGASCPDLMPSVAEEASSAQRAPKVSVSAEATRLV